MTVPPVTPTVVVEQSANVWVKAVAQLPPSRISSPSAQAPAGSSPTSANAATTTAPAPAGRSTTQVARVVPPGYSDLSGNWPTRGLPDGDLGMSATEVPTKSATL